MHGAGVCCRRRGCRRRGRAIAVVIMAVIASAVIVSAVIVSAVIVRAVIVSAVIVSAVIVSAVIVSAVIVIMLIVGMGFVRMPLMIVSFHFFWLSRLAAFGRVRVQDLKCGGFGVFVLCHDKPMLIGIAGTGIDISVPVTGTSMGIFARGLDGGRNGRFLSGPGRAKP